MNKAQKTDNVVALKEKLQRASGVVLTEFAKVDVATMEQIRKAFRDGHMEYKVVKNSLLNLAIKETPMQSMAQYLQSSTGIGISYDDPIAPTKVAIKFVKDHEGFNIKGGFVERVFGPEEAENIANLPGKNELRAQILGLLNTVGGNLIGLLQGPAQQFLSLCEARARKLEEATTDVTG